MFMPIKIYKPDHLFCNSSNYIVEHRYVWEQANNAILLPWAEVHHINGIIIDNRIENLEAMTKSQHITLHNTKNMDNRFCLKCGSKTTTLRKLKNGDKSPHWQSYKNGWQCQICYLKEYRKKKIVKSLYLLLNELMVVYSYL